MKLTTNEGLGYTGSVTLSVKKGKTTLSSRTIHNAGCLNLFKFVASCLKGDFLSSMLPNKICLFSKSATENASDESS